MTATPSHEELVERLESIQSQGHTYLIELTTLHAAAALIRELVDALKPFALSSKRDWDEDAEDDTEVWSSQGPGWGVSKDSFTVGDLRRAAKALEAK